MKKPLNLTIFSFLLFITVGTSIHAQTVIPNNDWEMYRDPTIETLAGHLNQADPITDLDNLANIVIPPATSSVWGPVTYYDTTNTKIGWSETSQISSSDCQDEIEKNYFQTSLNIPANAINIQFDVDITHADDFARVYIFNSTYPNGIGATEYKRNANNLGTTFDYSAHIEPGQVNRIVVLHVDWCSLVNRFEKLEVTYSYDTAPAPSGLQFVVDSVNTGPGNTVTLPIRVNNFTGMANYQGTISFDQNVLSVDTVISPNAGVVNSFGMPGQGSVPNNAITFSWYDPALMTTTLPDSTVVMEITFVVDSGATTGFTDVYVDSAATPLGYSTDLNATSLITPTTRNGGLQINADAPTVSTANIVSNNANDITLAAVGDVISLSFTTSEEPSVTPTVSIVEGGAGAVSISGSGTSYTATKTVAAGSDGLVTFTITIQDVYGNSSTMIATTDGSSVTVDTELPTITCPTNITQNVDAGLCNAVVTFSTPTGADNLAGHSVSQIGGPVSGSAFPVGITAVTFSVTDAAGNVDNCSFDVTVVDNEMPTVLIQNITVELDINGSAIITPQDIDNGSSDVCGVDSLFLNLYQFDCTDVGTPVSVILSVTDVNGNTATNTAVVTVEANPVISLSGAALSEIGDSIPGVNFDLNGDDGPIVQNGSSFNFLAAPCVSTNDIGGDKNDDAATNNGVDVQDAFGIVKHILLIQPLSTPYKLIAADVNATSSINVLDAFQVLRKVANIETHFTNPVTGLKDAIWTFISSDYTFPNPTSPYGFDTRRFYIDPSLSADQNFVGVKLGDVNNSWNPAVLRPTVPVDSMHFVMDEIAAQLGQLITIPVRVRNFNAMTGYQYSMNWDPNVLKFNSVNHKAIEGLYGTEQIQNGSFTSAWVDMAGQSVTMTDGTIAFELVFEVVGSLGSETSFEITSDQTPTKAFNDQETLLGIGTATNSFKVESSTAIDPYELRGYKFGQNIPNPFNQSTSLVFSLGQTEEVEIVIYNITGQIVRQFSGKYPAGDSKLAWNGQNESGMEVSEGIYMVQLKAGGYVSSIRVMKSN